MPPTPSTLLDESRSRAGGQRELLLLVMGNGMFATHPLPAGSQVVVGRGEDADVHLPDTKASRRHARFHVGNGDVEIEDLGSANGTRVLERRLPPEAKVKINPGEAIKIGGLLLLIDFDRPASAAARPPLTHAELEARIEWECARAEATAGVFSVARLLGDAGGAATAALRPVDVVGAHGPGDHGLLLPGLTGEAAAALARAFAGPSSAVRAGIASYPGDGLNAAALLARAASRARGEERVDAGHPDDGMRRLEALAARAAASDIPVLILGETGAGKEVLARTVHEWSRRAARPLVGINCAALTDSLFGSELYGHERGAFTGAVEAKPGLLETAPGGTVFLDEIGELSLAMQVKLLRVIETREVTRVGGVRPRKLDVRFIAATNRDLPAEVSRGAFRSDLYYRLNGITLTVPPLRDRPRDIVPLARAFAAEQARAMGRPPPELSPAALDALAADGWPGNIRELRNVVQRAVVLCDATILREHLPDGFPRPTPADAPPPAGAPADERARILAALAACGGNQSRAARQLGISRKVLIARLDSYGVARPRKQGQQDD
jgi:two-component system response regulator AtoC